MKRLLITIALALVALFLLKDAPKSETAGLDPQQVLDEVYATVDERLEARMPSLELGAELSAAFADAS